MIRDWRTFANEPYGEEQLQVRLNVWKHREKEKEMEIDFYGKKKLGQSWPSYLDAWRSAWFKPWLGCLLSRQNAYDMPPSAGLNCSGRWSLSTHHCQERETSDTNSIWLSTVRWWQWVREHLGWLEILMNSITSNAHCLHWKRAQTVAEWDGTVVQASVKQLEDRSCNSEIHKPILLKGCTKWSTKALRYMLKNKLQTRWPATHQQPNHTQMARWSSGRDPNQAQHNWF